MVVGEFPCGTPQWVGAGGVADHCRPGGKAAVCHRAVPIELVGEARDRSIGVLPVHVGLGRKIPHPCAKATADTDFGQPVEHFIEETNRAGFEEGGGAAAQHLESGELSGATFVAFLVGGVQVGQPDEDVLFERRVVGHVSTGERFAGDVDMSVDHAGGEHEPIAAQSEGWVVTLIEVCRLAHLDNHAVVHGHRASVDDVAMRVHRDHVPSVDHQVYGTRRHIGGRG